VRRRGSARTCGTLTKRYARGGCNGPCIRPAEAMKKPAMRPARLN